MNSVQLIGRITKDTEIKYTTSGVGVVTFTLAVDRDFKDESGNRQTDFINCVAWRQQADFLAKYIKKGYLLAVQGSIQTRNYDNGQGQKVYVTEIVCNNVQNLQPKEQEQSASNQQPSATIDDNSLPF